MGYGLLGANTCVCKTKSDMEKERFINAHMRDKRDRDRERGRVLMYVCGNERENQSAWYTHSFQCISFFSPSNPQVDHHKQILSLTSMS